MDKVIRVTSKGNLVVQPDQMIVEITLKGLFKDYAKTLQQSTEQINKIKDILKPLGFESTDIKTIYFDINAEYEYYGLREKERLVGYKFIHKLKIEFPKDNELLGRILSALSNSKLKPNIDIRYTVSDPEEAKNKLLDKAIQDSKRKAEVLTTAAGVKLGVLQTIDYSWSESEILIENRAIPAFGLSKNTNMLGMPDIEPDDIELEDTITIVWRIEE